jgi:HD superfamily phosphohydrolase
MHKAVYFHKTTLALETACRQLLRRCLNEGGFDLPGDGDALRRLLDSDSEFLSFTDNYVDQKVQQCLKSSDPVIQKLGHAIVYRKPPKLLQERAVLVDTTDRGSGQHNACTTFIQNCKSKLTNLAKNEKLPIGCFLIADPGKPLRIEKRGPVIHVSDADSVEPDQEDELIKVFNRDDDTPQSLSEFEESVISKLGKFGYRSVRLYVVDDETKRIERLRDATADW